MLQKKTVELKTNYLIRECSKFPLLENDLFYNFCLQNRENIHEVFKYKKFNEDFTDQISCYNDENHIIGYFRPSYEEFLNKLCRFLNIKDLNLASKRLIDLSKIKYEQELRKEFPYLYEDLIDGRRYLKNIERREKENPSLEGSFDKEIHYYYACGLRRSFDGFIKTQKEVYKRFVERREEYHTLIQRRNYNSFIRNYFDEEKVCLYVLSEYINTCKDSSDKEELKRYLNYLNMYLKSKYKKDSCILLEDNQLFSIDSVLEEIKNIENKLKESKKIVGWEIVPPTKEVVKESKKSKTPRKISLTEEEVERLKEKGNTKQDFYKNTNYLVKVLGLLKNKGYVAYIYPNGEVLLEKEYDSDKPNSALGNAIYHMKARDFLSLSKLDKKELRKKKEVGRIIHSKNWMERIESIIGKEGTEEEKEEAKSLIKKFQE